MSVSKVRAKLRVGGRLLPALFTASIIFAISHIPSEQIDLPSGGKLETTLVRLDVAYHLIIFLILSISICFGIRARSTRTLLLSALIATAYGISDEFHQLFIRGRDAQIIDMFINCLGATLGSGIWKGFYYMTRSADQPAGKKGRR